MIIVIKHVQVRNHEYAPEVTEIWNKVYIYSILCYKNWELPSGHYGRLMSDRGKENASSRMMNELND